MSKDSNHLHSVFFSLKDNSPARTRKLLDDCFEYLRPIRGILFFAAGTRAPDCVRDVNDTTFDVSLVIMFQDRAEHNAYQADPRHLEFVERNKENWATVRVLDSDVPVR